jgi:hypothetical protein
MHNYTTSDPSSLLSSFRTIINRLFTRRASAQRPEPWDATYSAYLDSHIIAMDAIDDLKRLFLTGTVEVFHDSALR